MQNINKQIREERFGIFKIQINKLLDEFNEGQEECWLCGDLTKTIQIFAIYKDKRYLRNIEWREFCHDICFEYLLHGTIPDYIIK